MSFIKISLSMACIIFSVITSASSSTTAATRIYRDEALQLYHALQGGDQAGQVTGQVSCKWSTENQSPEFLKLYNCSVRVFEISFPVSHAENISSILLNAGITPTGNLENGSLEVDISCDRHIDHYMADIGVEGEILDYTICTIQ